VFVAAITTTIATSWLAKAISISMSITEAICGWTRVPTITAASAPRHLDVLFD
jgi:hypothetical protein